MGKACRTTFLSQVILLGIVPTITADEFIARYPESRPSLLKVDVEGAETDLLNGAVDLLRQYRPELLLALLALTVAAPAQQPLIEGQTQSTVRVLIYEDLQCSDCADFRRMMDEKILPRYADKAAFIHRDFPRAKHAWARKAAIAARYFGEIKPELGLAYRRQ